MQVPALQLLLPLLEILVGLARFFLSKDRDDDEITAKLQEWSEWCSIVDSEHTWLSVMEWIVENPEEWEQFIGLLLNLFHKLRYVIAGKAC